MWSMVKDTHQVSKRLKHYCNIPEKGEDINKFKKSFYICTEEVQLLQDNCGN